MNYKEFSDEFKRYYMACDEDELDSWQLRELVAEYVDFQDTLRAPSQYKDEVKERETDETVERYINELYDLYDSILEWLGDAPQYKIEPKVIKYYIHIGDGTEDEDYLEKEYMVNRLIIPSHKLVIDPVGHSFIGGGKGGVDMILNDLGSERFLYYADKEDWQNFDEDPPGWFWMETSRRKFKYMTVNKELFMDILSEMKEDWGRSNA